MSSFHSSGRARILRDHEFHAARAHHGLGALEGAVLADHDARDLVEQRSAAAHVAGRKRRVERAARVLARLEAARVLEGVHLRVQDGAAALHAAVVAAAYDLAVEHEHGADRDAAFGHA
jgi:hypothetical protein